MRRFGKRSTVIATALSVMLVAGVAFAAWTSTGSGPGTAASRTAVPSVIASVSVGDGLYPGAELPITVSITNPNPYPVSVTKITGATSAVSGGCAAGTVVIDDLFEAGAALEDIAGETVIDPGTGASATYELTSYMAANAHNDCKSKQFTMTLGADLVSAATDRT